VNVSAISLNLTESFVNLTGISVNLTAISVNLLEVVVNLTEVPPVLLIQLILLITLLLLLRPLPAPSPRLPRAFAAHSPHLLRTFFFLDGRHFLACKFRTMPNSTKGVAKMEGGKNCDLS
jgi:hypothetical protein